MLRLMGAVLLVAGSGGLGWSFCMDMRRRLACLQGWKRLYEKIYSQVDYTREALPEICRLLAGQMEAPFGSILADICREEERRVGRPFPEIWEEVFRKALQSLPLKEEEKEEAARFAHSFGCADRELQKQDLTARIRELEERIGELKSHMAEREKLFMSLSVMGGMLLVILLL